MVLSSLLRTYKGEHPKVAGFGRRVRSMRWQLGAELKLRNRLREALKTPKPLGACPSEKTRSLLFLMVQRSELPVSLRFLGYLGRQTRADFSRTQGNYAVVDNAQPKLRLRMWGLGLRV